MTTLLKPKKLISQLNPSLGHSLITERPKGKGRRSLLAMVWICSTLLAIICQASSKRAREERDVPCCAIYCRVVPVIKDTLSAATGAIALAARRREKTAQC